MEILLTISIRLSVSIITHPPAPRYSPPPINSKNLLCFENLFSPSEGADSELLVSIF